MRYSDINVGDTLRMHKDRAQAYGLIFPDSEGDVLVYVDRLHHRTGYKVGFVVTICEQGKGFGDNKSEWFFKPSDFKGKL